MLRKLLAALRPRPEEDRRSEGELAHDREVDARFGLVDGDAVAPDGDPIDFESDLEPPRP
jgi:hypothetical protein